MAMAMMTGSQPEYSTSLVAGLRRASITQTGPEVLCGVETQVWEPHSARMTVNSAFTRTLPSPQSLRGDSLSHSQNQDVSLRYR